MNELLKETTGPEVSLLDVGREREREIKNVLKEKELSYMEAEIYLGKPVIRSLWGSIKNYEKQTGWVRVSCSDVGKDM